MIYQVSIYSMSGMRWLQYIDDELGNCLLLKCSQAGMYLAAVDNACVTYVIPATTVYIAIINVK